jgi:hypothetical protein
MSEASMHPHHHALSSVQRWGGVVEDYLPIHDWFDESKQFLADFRHRALRHHTAGIFLCERIFGPTLTNSDGRVIPVRWVGEQHVKEDLGRIPTVQDWFENLMPQPWMRRVGKLGCESVPSEEAAEAPKEEHSDEQAEAAT